MAAYDYFALPSSLTARLVPRKTRINVDPEYVVLADSDQIRLEAQLRYTVRGAKIAAVDIAMPDWQIDEVGPDSVVAVDGVPTGAARAPVLPCRWSSPTSGQFEIRLKAHRRLPPDAKSFSLVLAAAAGQRPGGGGGGRAAGRQRGDRAGQSDDDAGSCGSRRPCRWNFPRGSRSRCSTAPTRPRPSSPRNSAAISQQITAGVNSQVTLEPAGPRVEQKFSYSIAYEPTDYLLLDVPRAGRQGRLELTCDDQALAPVVLGDEATTARSRCGCAWPCPKRASAAAICRRVSRLPPRRRPAANSTFRWSCHWTRNLPATTLSSPRPRNSKWNVDLAAAMWTAVDGGLRRRSPQGRGRFPPPGRRDEIVLKLRGDSGDAAVVVQRAWLQTCLPPLRRAARPSCPAVHHAAAATGNRASAGPREQAAVQLFVSTATASAEQASAWPVAPATRTTRALTVPLPPGGEAGGATC